MVDLIKRLEDAIENFPVIETHPKDLFVEVKEQLEQNDKEIERLLAGDNFRVIKQLHANMKEMASEKHKLKARNEKLEQELKMIHKTISDSLVFLELNQLNEVDNDTVDTVD
jgi:hypothetical protein